jgi:hypothetical protein
VSLCLHTGLPTHVVIIVPSVGDRDSFKHSLLIEPTLCPDHILSIGVVVPHEVLQLLDVLVEADLIQSLIDICLSHLLPLVLFADVVRTTHGYDQSLHREEVQREVPR